MLSALTLPPPASRKRIDQIDGAWIGWAGRVNYEEAAFGSPTSRNKVKNPNERHGRVENEHRDAWAFAHLLSPGDFRKKTPSLASRKSPERDNNSVWPRRAEHAAQIHVLNGAFAFQTRPKLRLLAVRVSMRSCW
jgi:hypothetical protein